MRKLSLPLAVTALATFGLATFSQAQITKVQWSGTTGNRNWQDNANWIGGAFPNGDKQQADLSVNLGSNLSVDLGPTGDITLAGLSLGSKSAPIATNIFSSGVGPTAARLVFSNKDEDVITATEDADFDNDTIVDGRDFLIWQRGFGSTADNINRLGDANNDDIVNEADLLIWQDQYGIGSGPTNAGAGYILSDGVAGVSNTISSTIHSLNENIEIAGSRNLTITGPVTYQGNPENAAESNGSLSAMTPGLAVNLNSNFVMANTDGVDGVDFRFNSHFESQGTLNVNGVISGVGDLQFGSIDNAQRLPLSTIQLNSHNTYTGSVRAGRGNLIIANENALGRSLNKDDDNGTPLDTSDDKYVYASYRQDGPANQYGYNLIATQDVTIYNEMTMAQWQTIKGSNSINFAGHITQTNNRGIINMLPAGETVTISGDLDIWEDDEVLERRFVIDGTGKTIISGTVSDDELGTTGQDRRLQKTGTGVLIMNVAAGANNHSGSEVVSMGNMHYISNNSLNVSLDTKAKILSTGGAVGVDVHPGGQTLATNTTFINKFNTASVGGLMLAASDANVNLDFSSGAFNTVKNMSLAAPETGITYTGTLTPFNNQYRLGGGTGKLTLPSVQLTGATRSLSVRNGGTVRLEGANTYGGATTIESKYTSSHEEQAASDSNNVDLAQGIFLDRLVAPVLEVTALANGGAASSIGNSSNAASNLYIHASTLKYVGTGSTTDRLFTIGTGGATLDSSGSGPVVFSNSGAAISADAADIIGTLDDQSRDPNVIINASNSRDVVIGMPVSDPAPGNPDFDFTPSPCAANGANCIPALDTQVPPKPVVVTGVSDNGREIGISANFAIFTSKFNTQIVFGAVDRTLKLTGSNAQANVLTPVISDSVKGSKVGITKDGTGTWYLESVNTNTGPTLVTAGTLGGNGGVGGALTVNSGATFAPGSSGATAIGDFSVAGSFTLNAGAILGIQLGGTAASAYDKLNVTGAATLSGSINLSAVSFSPALTNAFTVLTAAGGIVDNGLTITGLTGFTKSIVGNSLILTKTAALNALASAVPEPSSMVLIGLAVACCGLRRK